MARSYAAETSVSVEKTRLEIEAILQRHGADAFGYSAEAGRAVVAFRIHGRHVRFTLTLPDRRDEAFWVYHRGGTGYAHRRSPDEALKRWEQACRQRWRALALVIRAKLEAVSAGITTVEDEFLAATVLGDGRTVSEEIQPRLAEHYRVGGPSTLMLEGPR